MPWLREKKFWPTVARIDDGGYLACTFLTSQLIDMAEAFGDLNLIVSSKILVLSGFVTESTFLQV